jgi:hypothetical protein
MVRVNHTGIGLAVKSINVTQTMWYGPVYGAPLSVIRVMVFVRSSWDPG